MSHPIEPFFLICVLALAVVAQGQETGAIVKLGSVQVDSGTKTMVISGWVNQVSGALTATRLESLPRMADKDGTQRRKIHGRKSKSLY